MKVRQQKKKIRARVLALHATAEEVKMLSDLKARFGRKTDSDMIRMLIVQASEKNLSPATAKAVDSTIITVTP